MNPIMRALRLWVVAIANLRRAGFRDPMVLPDRGNGVTR
ncbi:MAG: hypothetical protein RLZZ436_4671, partial [Planctomycetota bacterium]